MKVITSLVFSDLGPRTIIIGIGIHIIMFIIIGCFCCCLLLLKLNCDNLVEGLAEVSMPIAGS